MNNWWSKIFCAVNFIDSIADAISNSENVLIGMPEYVPWKEEMYEVIENRIYENENETHRIKYIDCPIDEVGKYLLENFCKKEKVLSYRAGKTYAQFLAESNDITLNSYILWVKSVTPDKLNQWIEFISDYRRNISNDISPVIFVLEVSDTISDRQIKETLHVRFSNSVSQYDKYIFCMLESAGVNISQELRAYYTDMVSTICGDDIELCAEAIKTGESFLVSPLQCLSNISNSLIRSDGTNYRTKFDEQNINKQIWLCQIKNFFPIIEEFRTEFINRHRKEIMQHLPAKNIFDEEFKEPEDVEIGMLYHMVTFCGGIQMKPGELEDLKNHREARNQLAHGKTLSLEEIKRLL